MHSFSIERLQDATEQDLCDRGCGRHATHTLVEYDLIFCEVCVQALRQRESKIEATHELVSA